MPTPGPKKHFSFYFFKWVILILIGITAFGLITKPVRKMWSKNYLERGNGYLELKKYESAMVEYKKAMFLFWKNDEAKKNIDLARRATINVLELENFYSQRKIETQIEIMRKSKSLPPTETEAVKLSKELIEKNEFQYAIIFAKDATEMDRSFRDGWLYLGIANLQAAKSLELRQNVRAEYLKEAKLALQRAKNLDPEYAPTNQYLLELQNTKQ